MGGDLEENDDFQIGSERLHDCFKASRLELGTLTWVVFRGGDLGHTRRGGRYHPQGRSRGGPPAFDRVRCSSEMGSGMALAP